MSQPIISEIEVDKKAFKSRGYESLWLINNGFKSNKVKVQGSKLIYPQSNRKVDSSKQKVKLNPSAVDEEEGLVQPSHVVFVVQAPAKPKKAVSVKTLSGATRVVKDVPAAVPKRNITVSTSPRKIVTPASVLASGANVTVSGSSPQHVISTKVVAPIPEPVLVREFDNSIADDFDLKDYKSTTFSKMSADAVVKLTEKMMAKYEPLLKKELADNLRGRDWGFINVTLNRLDILVGGALYRIQELKQGVINDRIRNKLDNDNSKLNEISNQIDEMKKTRDRKKETSRTSAKAYSARRGPKNK